MWGSLPSPLGCALAFCGWPADIVLFGVASRWAAPRAAVPYTLSHHCARWRVSHVCACGRMCVCVCVCVCVCMCDTHTFFETINSVRYHTSLLSDYVSMCAHVACVHEWVSHMWDRGAKQQPGLAVTVASLHQEYLKKIRG